MLKKVFKIMFMAMLAFSLVGFGVSTSFAGGHASNNQSWNASDTGKCHASTNSVLVAGDCVESSGAGTGGTNDEPPADDPPADDPPADDPCLDLGYFFFHPECWEV